MSSENTTAVQKIAGGALAFLLVAGFGTAAVTLATGVSVWPVIAAVFALNWGIGFVRQLMEAHTIDTLTAYASAAESVEEVEKARLEEELENQPAAEYLFVEGRPEGIRLPDSE